MDKLQVFSKKRRERETDKLAKSAFLSSKKEEEKHLVNLFLLLLFERARVLSLLATSLLVIVTVTVATSLQVS